MPQAFTPQPLPRWHRAVLKVGSSLLTTPEGGLTGRHAEALATFVARSRSAGREVVIVSSGAVAAGRGLATPERGAGLTGRQALAALGQTRLIALWQTFFDSPVAQVLLTHDDLRNRRRYLNARTTLRELLELAGGIRSGHRLKFWTPGGSSTPLFTDEQLDVPLDYESVAAAGSMLGTRSVQLFDETTCVVRVVLRWIKFYEHESCGKCTPCREGSWWVVQLLDQLERGEGSEADLDKLLDICTNITGRAFCALGDSNEAPVKSSIRYFKDEYLEHQRLGGCPFDPAASTLFAMESA